MLQKFHKNSLSPSIDDLGLVHHADLDTQAVLDVKSESVRDRLTPVFELNPPFVDQVHSHDAVSYFELPVD